jgi:hypothetical protein
MTATNGVNTAFLMFRLLTLRRKERLIFKVANAIEEPDTARRAKATFSSVETVASTLAPTQFSHLRQKKSK